MALTGRPTVLLLTLLTLLLLLRPCVQALEAVESLTDMDIPEGNQLGQGRRPSYRAQEQRAIFDLVTGILETLQTSAKAQVEREQRKLLLEAAMRHSRGVVPPSAAKT